MKCDLKTVYGGLALRVPTTNGDNFVFSAQTLPIPPAYMQTERLLVRRTYHDYNGWYRADSLWFQAHRSTYRNLALLILAVIFHAEPARVQLELTHPASDIKHIIIEYEHKGWREDYPNYVVALRPYEFNYYPAEAAKHPWYGTHSQPRDLPCFYLTNMGNILYTDEDWHRRDTVIGFGNDQGSIRLAEMLLNASRPQNGISTFELEGEGGFRGVGELSAEVKFYLLENEWQSE
jgi:hypothetical protein